MRVVAIMIAALSTAPLFAQQSAEQGPIPPDGDLLEPGVTIIQRDHEAVEEYRINNQVYMIKITPAKGPAYYLVDTDGDGTLETRRGDLEPDVVIPQWTIRWR